MSAETGVTGSLAGDHLKEVTIAGGTRIIVRLLRPDDKGGLKRGFASLSRESILRRFNDPIKNLTPAQLKYLTEIDHVHHLAFCAHLPAGRDEDGIGVARCVRIADEEGVAEFAIVVVDEYQNRGVGRLLMEELRMAAHSRGVRLLRGFVRDDNVPMLRLAERYSPEMKREGGGLLRIEVKTASSGSGSATQGEITPHGGA